MTIPNRWKRWPQDAVDRRAPLLLSESGLIADTADQLNHGCRAAEPCAGTSNAMNNRVRAG